MEWMVKLNANVSLQFPEDLKSLTAWHLSVLGIWIYGRIQNKVLVTTILS